MKTYNEISQDILARRDEYVIKQTAKRQIILRTTLAISCMCLLTIIGIAVHSIAAPANEQIAGSIDSECPEFLIEHGISDTINSDAPCPEYPDGEDLTAQPESFKIIIPQMTLPEIDETTSMDMIGLLVYRGYIYTQEDFYEKNDTILSLVGDYIGHAKGNLSEWSTQNDYAQELASTYIGDVYTVKGYDPEFRLCIVEEDDIIFLDHLNGIGLSTGRDLYAKRLHIDGGISYIDYLRYNDYYWDISRDPVPLALTDDELDSFINSLLSSEFFSSEASNNYPDDEDNAAFIFMHMTNGTIVKLLIKNDGSVYFCSTGHTMYDYYIKLPQNITDSIIANCK